MNRDELINVLEAVRPGLQEGKTLIEQSECFVFTNGECITFNDEVSVSAPLDLDIEGTVKAKEFHGYLKKVTGKEIELVQKEDTLLVRWGSKAVKELEIPFDSDIRLPIDDIPIPEDDEWMDLPPNFCDALSFVRFSVSSDFSQAILTNVYVHGKFADSSDNTRMTRFIMDGKVEQDFLVPARHIGALCAYKPEAYAVIGDWVHFLNANDVMFSIMQSEGDFPDLTPFLTAKGSAISLPEEVTETASRADVLLTSAVHEENLLEIESCGKSLVVKANGESGRMKEEFDYKGEKFKFAIPSKFAQEAFVLMNEAVLTENTVILKSDNFTHVSCIY